MKEVIWNNGQSEPGGSEAATERQEEAEEEREIKYQRTFIFLQKVIYLNKRTSAHALISYPRR